MKYILCLCLVLLLAGSASGTVLWENNFDSFDDDWVCCSGDCSVDPGNPTGFVGFKSNQGVDTTADPDFYYDDYCSAQIVEIADRGSGGRGFLNKQFKERVSTHRDSYLIIDVPSGNKHIFIRWYMNEPEVTELGGFDKILRIYAAGSQWVIPEFKRHDFGAGYIRAWNIYNASNSNQYPSSTWDADAEVTSGAWHCYEIELDFENGTAGFWFDGDLIGTLSGQNYPDADISYFMLGGNGDTRGSGWDYDEIQNRYYDDVVVSTTYIGLTDAVGCDDAGDCDDSNDCTDDDCVDSECTNENNTDSCEDGLYCTDGDACSGGACVAGGAMDCDDSNTCTDDSCNDTTDQCDHDNNTDACDDELYCTVGDTCSGGVCSGDARDCDDLIVCTTDTCNDTTDKCDHEGICPAIPGCIISGGVVQ